MNRFMATWIVSVALIFFNNLVLAQTYKSNPTGSVYNTKGSNLTDQERTTSETYIHQGLSQEAKDAGCNADEGMKDACAGKETHVLGNWVPMIIKAYAVVVGAGLMGTYEVNKTGSDQAGKSTEAGGTKDLSSKADTGTKPPTDKPAGDSPAGDQKPAQEKEKKEDYCKYVVMGTEALAMFQQTSAQQNLANTPSNISNAQTDQLYKAKRTHEERASTAEIQAYGWGAGAVCYVALIATGGYADWTLYLKMGLAGLASTYFAFEVGHQKDAAKKLQAIIDSMPKAGDCNPITETNCFCSQESSKMDMANYMKYCQPQIKAEQVANGVKMACINKQAQADPDCECTRNNSCFDVQFMNMIGGLKFGKSAEEVLGKSTAQLSRGKLGNGNLGDGTLAQSAAARAKAAMRSLSLDKLPKISGLSSDQQGFVNELSGLGIPQPLAALAVGVKAPANASQYANKLRAYEVDTSAYTSRNSDYGNSKVLTFTGGDGSFKKMAGKKDDVDFNKFLKKKEAASSDSNILKFAERASDSAQISKNRETVIFDIISNRYRVSGWKRVNFQ